MITGLYADTCLGCTTRLQCNKRKKPYYKLFLCVLICRFLCITFHIFRPREFIECISQIRLLSWLLLGSLTHTSLHGIAPGQPLSQPIPQEASCQIADHIQIIMAGFAEQPKASVLHMSSLFHTFILCQVMLLVLSFRDVLSHVNTVARAYTNLKLDFMVLGIL